jgi:hypothetical protein
MHCPQCGQQQASDFVKFCPRCGFPLEGVLGLLHSGGQLPVRYQQPGNRRLSPRQKGIRQGAMLMLSTFLAVPVVAILSTMVFEHPEVFVPITAIFCFMGGLLRILYALILQSGDPQPEPAGVAQYVPPQPQFRNQAAPQALPPQSVNPASGWRHPDTGEVVRPSSVTENTTRLLQPDERPRDS